MTDSKTFFIGTPLETELQVYYTKESSFCILIHKNQNRIKIIASAGMELAEKTQKYMMEFIEEEHGDSF